MINYITIETRVTSTFHIRISIIIATFAGFCRIYRIAIITYDIFVFIHLFLYRLLARTSLTAGRINITLPCLILALRHKEHILIGKGIHIIKHIPQTSIYTAVIQITVSRILEIICIMFRIERITLGSADFEIQNGFSRFFGFSPTSSIISILIFKHTTQVVSILRSTVPQRSSRYPANKRNQSQTGSLIHTTKILGSFHIFIRNHAISSLRIRHNLFNHRMNRFFLEVHIISGINHTVNIRSFAIHTQ